MYAWSPVNCESSSKRIKIRKHKLAGSGVFWREDTDLLIWLSMDTFFLKFAQASLPEWVYGLGTIGHFCEKTIQSRGSWEIQPRKQQ